MAFALVWLDESAKKYAALRASAKRAKASRAKSGKKKSSKQEGLFKQVAKTVAHLAQNPKHPGLQTHVYKSLQHPYDPKGKVFEAYIQQSTPGAWRAYWCYGPDKGQITVINIEKHPD